MKCSLLSLVAATALTGSAVAQFHVSKLVAPDGAAGDHFGSAVVQPDSFGSEPGWVAVAANDAAVQGLAGAGAVYLYRNVNNVWTYHSKVTSPAPQAGAEFGFSLSIASTTVPAPQSVLAVGAKFQDTQWGTDSGAVFTYRYNEITDVWDLVAQLPTGHPLSADDNYGQAVDIFIRANGVARVCVGAIGDDTLGFNAGTVYNSSITGGSTHRFFGSDSQGGDFFGVAVDVERSNGPEHSMVVGAVFEDTNGSNAGAAYYYRNITHTGGITAQETERLSAPDGEANDFFGIDVALVNNALLVGAEGDDDLGSAAGAVYSWAIDTLDPNPGPLGPPTKLLAPQGEAFDTFGNAVSAGVGGWLASSRGSSLSVVEGGVAVGALGPSPAFGPLFWNAPPGLDPFDVFSTGVTGFSSDGWAFASAPNDDDLGMDAGAVYVIFTSFLDCNTNGVHDYLELAQGTASDCNANGLLDTCEILAGSVFDCNGNGVPDECDIAMDPSLDCNGNGVPDSCEIAMDPSLDCNLNGVLDSCDIAVGTSEDCNGNMTPDECDISMDPSSDCNGNGIPDSCDIAVGTSLDCNGNGIPDACDVANDPSIDCNGNGIPDSCDIASGFSLDCNGNGTPDDCDIANATSSDINENGIPDECDFIGNTYCDPAAPNSTGLYAQLFVMGNISAAANDVHLMCFDLPANQFGYFLTGQLRGFQPFPGGSSGILCLSGAIGRFNRPGEVFVSDANGRGDLVVDVTDMPPAVNGPILSGQTWKFQTWYRDAGGSNNFSTAVEVLFE